MSKSVAIYGSVAIGAAVSIVTGSWVWIAVFIAIGISLSLTL